MSFYDATVPAFLQILNSLSGLLTKAEAHCKAKKIQPEVLLGARLFPDMLPLNRCGLTGEPSGDLVFRKVTDHCGSFKRFRIARTARNKWTLTAFSVRPVASAISTGFMSSTNRRTKTVRCRSERFFVASHTA